LVAHAFPHPPILAETPFAGRGCDRRPAGAGEPHCADRGPATDHVELGAYYIGADPDGSGLTGLRERAEALGGTLNLTSPAGLGTSVDVRLPAAVG
jgi:hypothetical protein